MTGVGPTTATRALARPPIGMRIVLFGLTLVIACGKRASSETEYIEREVAALKTHVADRDLTKVVVSCTLVKSSRDRMPAATAADIDRLCFVEEPRLQLEHAIASVKKNLAQHPDMTDIACMDLFVGDAYKTLAAHPPADPALHKLADEYAQLCPQEAAKHRAATKTGD